MKIYKKFSPVQTEILEEEFKKSEFYPKHRKIQKLSARFHSSYTKINNWFKYKRRKLYFLGRFSHYRLRKIFSQEENDALNVFFEQNSNPNHEEIKRISVNFPKIRVCQIRNWFSNRRRKERNDAKKMQRSKKTKEMPRKACLKKPEIKTKENLLEKNSLAPENNSHSNEKTLEIKQEYERSVQRKETELIKKEEICVKKEEIYFVKREEPKLLFSQNPFANNQTANFSNQNFSRFNMQNMNFFRYFYLKITITCFFVK